MKNKILLFTLVLTLLSSCSVTRCRYGNGLKISLPERISRNDSKDIQTTKPKKNQYTNSKSFDSTAQMSQVSPNSSTESNSEEHEGAFKEANSNKELNKIHHIKISQKTISRTRHIEKKNKIVSNYLQTKNIENDEGNKKVKRTFWQKVLRVLEITGLVLLGALVLYLLIFEPLLLITIVISLFMLWIQSLFTLDFNLFDLFF